MRDLVFTACFVAMLPGALRFTHIGAMLWTWVALIAPNNYLYGFARGLPFNKVVVAVAVVALFIDKARRKIYYDAHVRLLIAFFAISMVSYMFALSDKSRVDAIADRLFKEVLLCLFIVVAARSRLAIHSVLIAMGMGMSIHGAIEGAKFISAGGGHVLQAPNNIGDNNHFGLAILLVLPTLIYLRQYSVSPFVRLGLAVAIAINVVGVMATNSRGALIGLLAVGFTMFLRSKNKFGIVIVFLIVAGTAAALAPERWYGRMSTIGNAEEDGSFMGRVNSWKLHFMVALDRPLTGGGFSPMEDPAIWAAYLPAVQALDFIPTGKPSVPLAAHSIYFQTLGDTGFLGFGCFVGMIFVAFANLRRVSKLARDNPELEWAHGLAESMRFSMIAYTVSGAALSMAYFELYYIIITLISVLRKHVEETVIKEIPSGLLALQGEAAPSRGGRSPIRPGLAGGFGGAGGLRPGTAGFTPPR